MWKPVPEPIKRDDFAGYENETSIFVQVLLEFLPAKKVTLKDKSVPYKVTYKTLFGKHHICSLYPLIPTEELTKLLGKWWWLQ